MSRNNPTLEDKECVRSHMREALTRLNITYIERYWKQNIPNGLFDQMFTQNCIIDFAIFNEYSNDPIALLHVKRPYAKKYNNNNGKYKKSIKYNKYSQFGIPVIYCIGLDQIDQSIKQIISLLRPIKNTW